MPAITLAAVAAFQMIFLGKNDKTFLGKVVIFRVKFVIKRHIQLIIR
jgi:hypothetical protein